VNSESENIQVSVHILDKEYYIACKKEERDGLRASAQYLDKRMREIRQSGRIIGADRIAVIAALNITHELLEQRGACERIEQDVNQRIRGLQKKIESALDDIPPPHTDGPV
jgi:cell division protein ZapA